MNAPAPDPAMALAATIVVAMELHELTWALRRGGPGARDEAPAAAA